MGAVLAFLFSPIGRLLLISALAFAGGFTTHKHFSDAAHAKALAAAYRAKVTQLENRIRVVNSAATNDQQRAAEAEATRVKAEERARALEAQIQERPVNPSCPAARGIDGDRLRQLWGNPAGGAKRPNPPRPR
jgi:hypothetical protein